MTNGNHPVAAGRRGAGSHVPERGVEAEGERQFPAKETAIDADMRIVHSDVVGAENRREPAEEKLGNTAARRLDSDDQARVFAKNSAKRGEFGIVELMKDQVAHDHPVSVVAAKSAEIGPMPDAVGGPRWRLGPEIEAIDGNPGAFEAGGEFTGASADFEYAFAGPNKSGQDPGKPAVIAHHAVDGAEVATVVQRVGMIRRERVEQLGLNRTRHG